MRPWPARCGVPPLILLVDDEPLVRRVVGRILRGCGYAVVEAANGVEALAADQHALEPLTLLLTDVVMPGMNGVALAAQMEDRHPGLPVLFMSGYAPDGGLQERLARPGALFLGKPFGAEELAAIVGAAILLS